MTHKATDERQETLPGLDLTDVVARAEQFVDCRDKQYTAERLLVSHPDTYAIASRLFFEIGLSKRAVCDCCKVSSRTLNALIEREMKTRGAEVLYENVRRKKSMILYEIMDQLEELVNDEDAVRDAGIGGLIQAVRLLQGEDGKAKAQDASSNESAKSAKNEADTIEYTEIYRLSRIAKGANGLEGKENSAPRVEGLNAVDEGVVDVPCDADNSLMLSDNAKQSKAISFDVANPLPKSGEVSRFGNGTPPPVGTEDTPLGAGGMGGGRQPPCLPKMYSAERSER